MIDVTRLVRYEWVDREDGSLRMRFRRDGTGYYQRDASAEGRAISERLLYRVDDDGLHLKFAHARLWVLVDASLVEGDAPQGARIGEFELVLPRDPYAHAVDDQITPPLVLKSDRGAALPS